MTRKRHGDTSNSFNFATGEMDWDNALKGTYSAGTIAGMLGAGVMAGMNVKFSGMDAATNKFYGGEGAKTEKRDDGKRVVRLNGYRDDMTEAEQLAMGATLQWEAHRDGEVTADNYLETRQAFKSSTEMAQRMLAAGLDVDTSGVIGINLAAYEYAKSQGDMSMLDMFVDTFYRSDGDYQGIDFDKLTQELFTPGSDLQQKLRDLTQEGFKEFAGTSLPGNLGELDLSRLKEIQEQGKSAFEAASSYLPDRDVYVLADNAFKEMFQRFQRGESAPEPTTPPATDVAKQMLEGASAEFSYDFNKFSGGDVYGANGGSVSYGPLGISWGSLTGGLNASASFNSFYNTPGDASASFYAGIGFPWALGSFPNIFSDFNKPTLTFGANASLPLGNGFYLNANIEHTQPYVGQGKTTWGISASRGR